VNQSAWVRRFALLLLVAALGLGVSVVWAQETGMLTGQVVNGTEDGPVPGAGLSVVLRSFQGGAEVDQVSMATDADGRFRFENLDTSSDLEYLPEVDYLGVTYSPAAPYSFADGTTELTVTLSVYENTEDSASLRADGMHLIVDRDEESGLLLFTEIYLISNTGDRTVIGREGVVEGQRATVQIPLPDNAQDLFFPQMAPEEELFEVGGTLVDTRAVRPGTDSLSVIFVYALAMADDTVRLERSVAYPTANVTVLVPEGRLDLRSDQLEFRDVRPFEGTDYRHYATHGVMPGTALVLDFVEPGASTTSGVPQTRSTNGSTSQATIRTLGLVLAALAFVFAMVYPLASRPRRRTRRP
jgi:hypothetical protein